jgi:hypothetical protein
MAGIRFRVEIEIVEMDKVGLHLHNCVSHDPFEVVQVVLIGKARSITEGLLVSVGEGGLEVP